MYTRRRTLFAHIVNWLVLRFPKTLYSFGCGLSGPFMRLFTFAHIFIDSTEKLVNKKHTYNEAALSYSNKWNFECHALCPQATVAITEESGEMRNSPFYLFVNPANYSHTGARISAHVVHSVSSLDKHVRRSSEHCTHFH